MKARLIQLAGRYIAMAAAALLAYVGVENAENIAAEAGVLIATGLALVGGVIVDHYLHRLVTDKRK